MNADTDREHVMDNRRARGPLTRSEALADAITWLSYIRRGVEPPEPTADLCRRLALRWGWANERGPQTTKARQVVEEATAAAWRTE